MTPPCPQRLRLSRKIAEAVAAVDDLKDQQRQKTDTPLSILLDQARTAQRDAERELDDHIEEHGCLGSKVSKAKW
jgi:hypothetical protein